ncbi:MAG: hypothetical protein GF309_06840 [Candidatus Lokiarchaeota archaeon]|nr:hypothetical protein [Candidatus Lokiarchaeota archaeon]
MSALEIVTMFLVIIFAIRLYRFSPFPDKAIIKIEIRRSELELSLDASDNDVAERDFDSIIETLETNLSDSGSFSS